MDNENKKKCPNCNSIVDIDDNFCRTCGHNFSKDITNKTKKTFEDFLLEASKFRFSHLEKENKEDNNIEDTDKFDKLESVDLLEEKEAIYDDRKVVLNQKETKPDKKERVIQKKALDYKYLKDRLIIKNKTNITKYIMIALIAIVLSIGITKAYAIFKPMVIANMGPNHKNKESIRNVFSQSLTQRDKELLKSVAITDKGKLSEDDCNVFFEYLKNNSHRQREIIGWIDQDLQSLKSNKEFQSTHPIRMVLKNDSYIIEIKKINVSFEYPEEMNLKLNDAFVERRDNSFMPGTYKFSVTSNDIQLDRLLVIDYFNDRYHEDNNSLLFSFEDYNIQDAKKEFDITSGDKRLEIRAVGANDPIVFVNGKNTAMTVSQFNEFGSKNLEQGMDIQIVAKGNNGFISSRVHNLGYETWVRLHIRY